MLCRLLFDLSECTLLRQDNLQASTNHQGFIRYEIFERSKRYEYPQPIPDSRLSGQRIGECRAGQTRAGQTW